jgi:predicted MFS family arabinose efflux permease
MQDETYKKNIGTAIIIFTVIMAFTGFHQNTMDLIISNYFKEAYEVTATQRGLIEFPRELPGIVSMFVISAFSFLRDIKTAVIAQILGIIGLVVLGIFHPAFGIMLIFIFIYSLGLHMFMPLSDSIGLSLTDRENMGRLMGRFNSVRMAFGMIAGLVCFFGFRSGFFHFNVPVIIFLICAAAFLACVFLLFALHARIGAEVESGKEVTKIVFRKKYTRYYIICALFGARKQIMLVFSPWVLIELLGFRADRMAILGVIGAFIGIFFIPFIGRLIDRKGSRFTMIIEAGCFIAVYIAYGLLSRWINENTVVLTGIGMLFVYILFISDKMSAQFYMVRSIYLKSIAIKEEDVTPSLSAGMAIDHVVAITGAFLCGLIWDAYGPEYVFIIAAIISAANMFVAMGIKEDAVIDRASG